jgi:putative PIN family toxin of toxin-antitoxin system
MLRPRDHILLQRLGQPHEVLAEPTHAHDQALVRLGVLARARPRREVRPQVTLRRHPRGGIIYDMRVVLDTAVVVAALRSPRGASAELLRAARTGQVTLLASVALALEYEAVCREAEHGLASGLSEEEVGTFVTAVIALAEPVTRHFLWRPQLGDPDDEMVLEAAVNGRAQALVTFNVRHYREVPRRFGIAVLLPQAALARIRP